jgi:hypothetical protein
MPVLNMIVFVFIFLQKGCGISWYALLLLSFQSNNV